MIHIRATKKVEMHVKDTTSKDAKVTVDVKKLPNLVCNFYALTVMAGMTNEMQLSIEEMCGPVAELLEFSTEKEVVDLANAA